MNLSTPSDTSIKRYAGYLDGIWPNGEIFGWAIDRQHPAQKIGIHLYINDLWLGTTAACEYRADVREAGFGDGYSGFWLRMFTLDILQKRVKHGDVIRAFYDKERQHELPNSPVILDQQLLSKVRTVSHISENFQSNDGPIHFNMYSLCGGDHVVKMVCDDGLMAYENPIPLVICQSINALPGLFLDIGANSGLFSLMVASLGQTSSIAFEPFPKIHELLKCNIELNQFSDKIQTERLAISNITGQLKFYVPTNIGLIETSASLEPNFKNQHSDIIDVESSTLDDYLQAQGLKECPISVIKIDVEGHEPAVLEGAFKTIQKYRPIIIAEILRTANFDYFNHFTRTLNYRDVVFIDQKMHVSTQTRFIAKQSNHIFVPYEIMSERLIPLFT